MFHCLQSKGVHDLLYTHLSRGEDGRDHSFVAGALLCWKLFFGDDFVGYGDDDDDDDESAVVVLLQLVVVMMIMKMGNRLKWIWVTNEHIGSLDETLLLRSFERVRSYCLQR